MRERSAGKDTTTGHWEMAGTVLDTEFPAVDKFDALPATKRGGGPAAFLTVQEGCDKFCTFCVVPYTRGDEVSRPFEDVLVEVAGLADQGYYITFSAPWEPFFI